MVGCYVGASLRVARAEGLVPRRAGSWVAHGRVQAHLSQYVSWCSCRSPSEAVLTSILESDEERQGRILVHWSSITPGCRNCYLNARRARTSMLDEVYENLRRTWHDSAWSGWSRVVRAGRECHLQEVERVHDVRHVKARPLSFHPSFVRW